jgi:Zn-dependent protease with chaperone function
MTDDSTAGTPARRTVVLGGISSRAWEHPADRGALTALRELRGFDDILKTLFSLWNERAFRLEFLASSIRVDHRQYPRVYQAWTDVARTLDVAELPELYVRQSPLFNAEAIGLDKPFVVVNTAALQQVDDEELRALLGHELGHVLSGHAVYRTMLDLLTRWAVGFTWIPGSAIAVRVITAAMYEWWRKAELSGDRAGLLAGQDPGASLRLLMKMAGGGDLSQIDTPAFLEQAAEYEGGGDVRDSVLKLQMLTFSTHPVPVSRAAHLRRWIDSGAYSAILGGAYPLREDDATASVSDDVKAAAADYRAAFAESQDPLTTLLRKAGGSAGDVGAWAGGGASKAARWANDAARGAARGFRGDSSDGETSGDDGSGEPQGW